MIKSILNFLKCCKAKQKQQQKEEMDIQIVGSNKEIKKILSEYRIEDRDFNTFTSERGSVKTNNSKNEKLNNENSLDFRANQIRVETDIIEEAKENKINQKKYKETDLINIIETEMKNKNDYKNQVLKTEEQNLCQYLLTDGDPCEDDFIIVPEHLIREDEKKFIKYVILNGYAIRIIFSFFLKIIFHYLK